MGASLLRLIWVFGMLVACADPGDIGPPNRAQDSGRPDELPQKRDIMLLDLNDIPAVADFVIAHCGLTVAGAADWRAEQA